MRREAGGDQHACGDQCGFVYPFVATETDFVIYPCLRRSVALLEGF